MSYKYILEPYNGIKSRHTCPACGRKNEFTLYVNFDTGEYLALDVGRCNRIDKCGYHKTPAQHFEEINLFETPMEHFRKIPYQKPKSVKNAYSFMERKYLDSSLRNYDKNNFVAFLHSLFDAGEVDRLIKKYRIGTSKKWPGANIFWQIDDHGQTRTGKIMLYDGQSGHRIKKPYNHVAWVHSELKTPNFRLNQCLFGLHLLAEDRKPVAICESEKTAIISSVYLPGLTWLATGGKQNFGLIQRAADALRDRSILLYPDLGAFDEWRTKAKTLKGLNVQVSDYLDTHAPETDKVKGYDLADYLLHFEPGKQRPQFPGWFVDSMGILKAYEAGTIDGATYLGRLQKNQIDSGLTPDEYTARTNILEPKYHENEK